MVTTLEERVHIQHSALLIIDMQNDFVHQQGAFAKKGLNVSMFQMVVPKIKEIVDAARKFNIPLIFIRMIHSRWTNSEAWVQRFFRMTKRESTDDTPFQPYCLPDTWGAEWVDGLCPTVKDCVVTKHRYSGFMNTDLDLVLRSLKRRTVVVTGAETNICVATTAMGALMHDYYVVLPEDCIAGIDEESHRHGLKILNQFCGIVVPAKEIMEIWERQWEKG